jgi:hypothetical protein
MLFSAFLAMASTIAFRQLIATLGPKEIPSHRFVRLALVANLGIAAAGLALTVYLAMTAG